MSHIFYRSRVCGVTLTLLATACIVVMSSPSRAADPIPSYVPGYVPNSTAVHYGDLNLNTREGLTQLYARIVAAAGNVCGENDELSLATPSQMSICVRDTMARAVAAVGNPRLAALYEQKTGHRIDRKPLLAKR
jgi:UrcA family protein